ncbi:hypothetical protein M6B22_16120 [Jatrophihabitans cynanchi]|uniref:DUF6542 domain-containing protein n=1 Tax=Jatrophihabitans cynanchi TaxID=2944128 RepID=A0ABY7JWL2_9ACTN|nr:DUF6542 domain-containing protein [Jatrophihabitans sp. SB3-54]WAX56053.1 hypothetical protein M6B22_16120 [Jatrophihabitans sp. SB3-54]
MANAPYGARGGDQGDDHGWGPARSVQSGSQGATRAERYDAPGDRGVHYPAPAEHGGRYPAEPRSGRYAAPTATASTEPPPWLDPRARPRERGLPWWGALLVLLAIAAIGGVIDTISGAQVRGGFNIGVVAASIIAILLVRRADMFTVVIAPPIVYSVASGAMVYLRSGGLHDRRALYDAASNWLVYGFPAIAAATAAVLIIAGIRLIVRR